MEIQAIESGQVPVSRRGWESATSQEVQAVAPKSPKAQLLAKQLHQLGGAFLLPHMPICDAWALTVFAERARRNPENTVKVLLCKLLTLEIGRRVAPRKRELLLTLLPEGLQGELATNTQLFPKPKVPSSRATLIYKPRLETRFGFSDWLAYQAKRWTGM